jgi:hypothetical protein
MSEIQRLLWAIANVDSTDSLANGETISVNRHRPLALKAISLLNDHVCERCGETVERLPPTTQEQG